MGSVSGAPDAVVSQSRVKSVGRKRELRRWEQTLSSLITADVATSFVNEKKENNNQSSAKNKHKKYAKEKGPKNYKSRYNVH